MKKFLFDTRFEGQDKPAATPPRYGEAELAAARLQAFEEGRAAGAAEAREQTEHMAAVALAELARSVETLSQAQAEADRQRLAGSAELAHRIATRLAPALMQRQPLAEVEALLSRCLADLQDEPRVVVRASETVIASLKERLQPLAEAAGFAGSLVLLPDDALTGSDCRIEWADGGMERDGAAISARVDEAVSRYLQNQGQ